jgi:hypothetical protein
VAVVPATPLDRRARIPRIASRCASIPGAAPVVLAAAARIAPLAPTRDLGRARLRLARVRLTKEGPVVDQPWFVARVVWRREAAVLRTVSLAAFVLAMVAMRVFAAVWCPYVVISQSPKLTEKPNGDDSMLGLEEALTVIAVLEPFRIAILDALHAVESIGAHGLAPKI